MMPKHIHHEDHCIRCDRDIESSAIGWVDVQTADEKCPDGRLHQTITMRQVAGGVRENER